MNKDTAFTNRTTLSDIAAVLRDINDGDPDGEYAPTLTIFKDYSGNIRFTGGSEKHFHSPKELAALFKKYKVVKCWKCRDKISIDPVQYYRKDLRLEGAPVNIVGDICCIICYLEIVIDNIPYLELEEK